MARPRAASPTYPARRRFAAVVLGIVGVAGLGLASASQVTVGSGTLGVGTAMVASCQPAGQVISVSFTSAFASGAYQATAVTLSNVNAACATRAYRIRLVNSSGVAIGTEMTGTVTLTDGAFTAAINPNQPTSSIASVAVVISS